MADTALSDQLSIFFRKIGWSVGLEKTLHRVAQLVRVYAEKGELSGGDIKTLLEEQWELSTDHIIDVLSGLGYIRRKGKQVLIERYLDTAAVCWLSLKNEEQFDRANQFILLNAIIENDGEIFLNCLKQEFDEREVSAALKRVIAYKRIELFKIFRASDLQQRIAHVVNVEAQLNNRGGGSAGKTKRLSDNKRTERLAPRLEPLSKSPSTEVTISEDYLRKVPPRRRDWAKSIGLCNQDGRLTVFGRNLLAAFDKLGCITPDGDVVLWPFKHEISRLRMNPATFALLIVDQWDLIKAVFTARGLEVATGIEPEAATSILFELSEHFEFYRKLDRPKSMLRREYPLLVAMMAFAGIRYGKGEKLPDLLELIQTERTSSHRRLDMRPSRTNIGSLTFRR